MNVSEDGSIVVGYDEATGEIGIGFANAKGEIPEDNMVTVPLDIARELQNALGEVIEKCERIQNRKWS